MIDYKKNFYSTTTKLFQYLEKKRQNEKTMQTFEIVATFSIITFFIVFAIKPAINTIVGLVGEIKAKEEVVGKLSSKINQIVKAQDIFSQVEQKYKVIESALPSRPRYAQAGIQYGVIGQKTGINTRKINFGPSSGDTSKDETSNKTSIVISFSDKVTFSAVSEFVDAIKRNRRLIETGSISFSTDKDQKESSDSNKIGASISTKALYWTE